MIRSLDRCTSLLVLAGLLAGCGAKGPQRVAVSGTVTFDGQPVNDGQVVFTPQADGMTAAGPIVAGRYNIATERGPSPGLNNVRITANRPTGRKVQAGGYAASQAPQDVMEQYIPAKYNDSSELSVEFEAASAATHDFELNSAK
jgi:hypothetical protein